jgi:hypothetical protein
MKSKTKKNNKHRIFKKYSKNNEYLTEKEMVRLLKKEFKLYYNKYIIISMMNIWGEKINKKYVITYQSYLKMFRKPDGFLRNIIP